MEIEKSPKRYPVICGHLRRILLRRFSYAVYYKFFPSTISVVGVITCTETRTPGCSVLPPNKYRFLSGVFAFRRKSLLCALAREEKWALPEF